jgi:hypothetical protein
MADPTTKAELVDLIQAEYGRFQDLLAPLTEQQMTEKGVTGEWSVKDILNEEHGETIRVWLGK